MPFLIAQGADVNVRNNEGCAPLDVAQLDEVRVMLREAGVDGFTAAERSAINEFITEFGRDVKAVDWYESAPQDSTSADETLLVYKKRVNAKLP